MKHKTNTGDRFESGQVWQTSRGTLWRVTALAHVSNKPRRQALLRLGDVGVEGGRKQSRDWDAVIGWSIYRHVDGTLARPAPEGRP